MGIDVHVYNFLTYACRRKTLGKTLTLGRQEVHVDYDFHRNLISTPNSLGHRERYCEGLLKSQFGASSVESMDASDYEHAGIVHDLNSPAPDDLIGKFDSVLDLGTCEHVYDAPQALGTVFELCRVGGQIVHVLPANDFNGHGFWQFSPELFFSLYRVDHGYSGLEMFFAEMGNLNVWHRVHRPPDGERIEVVTGSPTYLLVRVDRIGDRPANLRVQQSDYVERWGDGEGRRRQTGNGLLRGFKTRLAAFPFYQALRRLLTNRALSLNRSPHLERVSVKTLIGS